MEAYMPNQEHIDNLDDFVAKGSSESHENSRNGKFLDTKEDEEILESIANEENLEPEEPEKPEKTSENKHLEPEGAEKTAKTEVKKKPGYTVSWPAENTRDKSTPYQVKPIGINTDIELPNKVGTKRDKALQQRHANVVEGIKEYLNYAHLLAPNSAPEIGIAANKAHMAVISKYIDGFTPVSDLQEEDKRKVTGMKGFGEMLAIAAATGDMDINHGNVGVVGDRVVKIDGGQALSNFYTSPESLKASLDRSLQEYYGSSFDEVMKNELVKKEFYDKLTEISKTPKSEITEHMDRRAEAFDKAAEGKELVMTYLNFGYRIDGESDGFGASDIHDVKEFLKDGVRLNHTVITQMVDDHGVEKSVQKDAIFEANITAHNLGAGKKNLRAIEKKFKGAKEAAVLPGESLGVEIYKQIVNNSSIDDLFALYGEALKHQGSKSEATMAVKETIVEYIKDHLEGHLEKHLENAQVKKASERVIKSKLPESTIKGRSVLISNVDKTSPLNLPHPGPNHAGRVH